MSARLTALLPVSAAAAPPEPAEGADSSGRGRPVRTGGGPPERITADDAEIVEDSLTAAPEAPFPTSPPTLPSTATNASPATGEQAARRTLTASGPVS